MADSESGQSKKRVAGRQISKENPEFDDDSPEPEMGFKKASDDVLAARRIVKVKRSQPPTQSSASNPFASLKLVPPSDPSSIKPDSNNDALAKTDVDEKQEKVEEKAEEKAEEKTQEEIPEPESKVECDVSEAKVEKNIENEETVKEGEAVNEPKEAEKEEAGEAKQSSSVTSFGQLSTSQNAFMGLAGTGFGTTSFSFGSISADKPSFSSTTFNMSSSNNGNTPTMQEKPIETGEENEKAVFTADAALYEYIDGNWKERGKGEVKLNVSLSEDAKKARLVMRTKGNYRLILNASLYPDMTLTNMDKKGLTFACINSAGEGKTGLATFAIKFKDGSFVQEFRGAVDAHKGKKSAVSKTPENSPKAFEV